MRTRTVILLYSQDAALTRRLTGALGDRAILEPQPSAAAARAACRRRAPALLLLDLTADDARALIRDLRETGPETVIIAFGTPRSEPALYAQDMGVYAVEPPRIARTPLQARVRQALAHLRLIEENRALRTTASPASALSGPPPDVPPAGRSAASAPAFGGLARTLDRFTEVDPMLQGVVESVAEAAGIARVGLVAFDSNRDVYGIRAGVCCLPESTGLTVDADDPFVEWLRLHAHAVTRATLAHVTAPADQAMLSRRLDEAGAEVIVPLYGRERLVGWLLAGPPASGRALAAHDIDRLMALGRDCALALDHALLTETAATQKALGDTVLRALPEGIVAIDTTPRVRWCNDAAARQLGLERDAILGRPPSVLGSRLCDRLLRTADGTGDALPDTWIHPVTRLPLAAVVRPLVRDGRCLGAVAMLHDRSREHILHERQERLERAAFWTELAAAISHEVRNPLVAISTFAQLLPERYDDPEFRNEFSGLAVREIGRLNELIDQINAFANPPELVFEALDLVAVVREAASRACEQTGGGPPVRVTAGGPVPAVRGDRRALLETLVHLVANAVEALADTPDPAVDITVRADRARGEAGRVEIRIEDNGPGVAPDLLDKVFSPFCSVKARGIGLGLPIARRTITDHGGRIDIETGTAGTAVVITLPTAPVKEATAHEAAYPGRG